MATKSVFRVTALYEEDGKWDTRLKHFRRKNDAVEWACGYEHALVEEVPISSITEATWLLEVLDYGFRAFLPVVPTPTGTTTVITIGDIEYDPIPRLKGEY